MRIAVGMAAGASPDPAADPETHVGQELTVANGRFRAINPELQSP